MKIYTEFMVCWHIINPLNIDIGSTKLVNIAITDAISNPVIIYKKFLGILNDT